MTTPMPTFGTIISLADANTVAGNFGKTITQQEISLAELCISLRTGLALNDPDFVGNVDPTDRYWLAQAVVLQAIWLKGQPDLLVRLDQSMAETDGDALTLNHDGIALAPLAKWAILKTTFMGWDTADVAPTENMLGTGIVARNPEDVGFRRWGR